ncbi:MAG: hypothetical protein BGP11_00335 [Rhodobacterales bacterium 65-51]|uniref:hypothetical protein n=1 Tax=uncultured Gemmobacter sp. TaxID=1095917 RepID=UPI000960B0B7|nr:hypothetical protein [uncultured Gemmobacter sp.]OJY35155.1 MAG: hypothetical protein BGP11_00335 [Rhodobacterales bacterium 65-51]
MRLFLAPALLSLLATPAAADAVAQMVTAYRLFDLGEAAQDGLSQIAAARLAAGVEMQVVDRKPEATGGKDGGTDSRPAPRDPAALMELARVAVEADETLAILLQETAAMADLLPKVTLRQSAAMLRTGEMHSYRLPLDGGTPTEIGVIGDGDSRLLLEIGTEAGPLCLQSGISATCAVSLPESGFVTVTLRNLGEGVSGYWLLTE